MFAYFHLLVTAPLAITFAGATVSPDELEAGFPTVAGIREAWVHRSRTMEPYVLRAALSEQVAIEGRPRSADPFETRRTGSDVKLITVQKTIGIKKDGAKIRTAVRGESVDRDNGEVSEQQRHNCFDGQAYRMFSRRADAPFGLGAFGTDGTVIWLKYKTTEFQAIDWWLDPLTLFNGASDANVQLSETSYKLLGRECMKLQVIKDGRIRSSITVSKTRPFLPIEVVRYSADGKEGMKCAFFYSLEASGFERLVSWRAVYFEPGAVKPRKFNGKVVEFTRGKPIGENEFRLTFPVGTHLTEYVGKSSRRWLQYSPTEMRPMKEANYGRLPETRGKPAS